LHSDYGHSFLLFSNYRWLNSSRQALADLIAAEANLTPYILEDGNDRFHFVACPTDGYRLLDYPAAATTKRFLRTSRLATNQSAAKPPWSAVLSFMDR